MTVDPWLTAPSAVSSGRPTWAQHWLQRTLTAAGMRPISALVDITNYFTFALNRPLHVFDADKVKGGVLRIHPAKGGEELLALDGKTYTLDQMETVYDDRWNFGEKAQIIALNGGLAPGQHKVEMAVRYRVSYLPFVPTTKCTKELALAA